MNTFRNLVIYTFFFLSFVSVKATSANDSLKTHPKDSITIPIVRTLRFDNSYAVPSLFIKDSINAEFYRTLPYFKSTNYPAYLGVAGQAAYSLSYFDNKKINDMPFLAPFGLSFYSNTDNVFYNVRRPFTSIRFTGSANAFEAFKALHTQNITKEWNIGFEMNFYGALGAFTNQKASTHQMKAFTTYFGPRYSLVGQYSVNRLITQENGGIDDVSNLRNSAFNLKLLNVNLPNANSTTRFTQLYFRQEFNLSGRYRKPDTLKVELQEFPICFGHEMKAERSYRSFTETMSTQTKGFYPNLGLDNLKTKDSAICRSFTNFAYLKVSANRTKSNSQTLIGGVGVETEKYYFADREMWDKPSLYNNGFVQGSLWNYSKSHRGFDGNARFYLTGRKQANTEATARLYNDFQHFDSLRIEASVEAQLTSPAYFYTTYRSNHFTWNNDNFLKQQTTTVIAQLYSLRDSYHAKASISMIKNYVFVSENLNINQNKSEILVYALDLGKRTNSGMFYISNNIVFQHATSKDIPVPFLATVNTYAIKARFYKKAMTMKLGVDVYYWTKFYTPAYMPELGVFYKQTSNKNGDFSYVDAFVQFDFKRMQLFLKYSHTGYFASKSNTFFSVDHYPLDKPAFSYGLSWYFYN